MDSVALVAVSAAAISSGERPSASDSSETVGSRPKSPVARLFDGGGALFHAAADLDRAVVAQKAADLSGNFGDGVGGKLRAVGGIKALDRL